MFVTCSVFNKNHHIRKFLFNSSVIEVLFASYTMVFYILQKGNADRFTQRLQIISYYLYETY